MSVVTSSAQPSRRDFLYVATGAVGAIGAAFAAVPLIVQMNPDASTIAAGAPVEIDLAPIAEGQIIKVFWRSKPIFISHRNRKEIDEARNANWHDLPDPEPDSARTKSGHDQWLVVIGICTHLGCIPLPWWVVLSVPRLPVRHRRPRSPRPRAQESLLAPVRIPRRHQDTDWLSWGYRQLWPNRGMMLSTRIDGPSAAGCDAILAFHPRNRYFPIMLSDIVRRLSAVLLTLTLVFGPAVSSAHASSMGAKMMVAALSDMHSSGKCDDCGGSKGGMPVGACSMNCSGVTAVSSGSAVFQSLPVQPHGQVVTPGMTGLDTPPDPYPPRPTVLS